MNPFSDTLGFLFRGGASLVLWLLLLGSLALAVLNLRRSPEQRTVAHVWM